MAKKKTSSYEDSIQELERIIAQIETEEIGIDALREKIIRAKALISQCNLLLRGTEDELEGLMADLDG